MVGQQVLWGWSDHPLSVRLFGKVRGLCLITPRLKPLLPIPEKLDIHAGQWATIRRVCHVVETLAVKLFTDDGRIGNPDHDLAGIAIFHIGRHQVSTRFLQRRRYCNTTVKVIFPGLYVDRPAGNTLTEIFRFLLLYQAPADIVDIYSVVIESTWI